MEETGPNYLLTFAEVKIDSLLHAFFALQNPGYARPTRSQFDQFGRPEEHNEWEAQRLVQDADIATKEQYIKDQFLPIAKALNLGQADEPYETLVAFCNTVDLYKWMADDYGSPAEFDARDYLPPKGVVTAMTRRWAENPKAGCLTLREYLEQVSLQTALD